MANRKDSDSAFRSGIWTASRRWVTAARSMDSQLSWQLCRNDAWALSPHVRWTERTVLSADWLTMRAVDDRGARSASRCPNIVQPAPSAGTRNGADRYLSRSRRRGLYAVPEFNGDVFMQRGSFRYELRAAADDGAMITDDEIGFGTEVKLQDSDRLVVGKTVFNALRRSTCRYSSSLERVPCRRRIRAGSQHAVRSRESRAALRPDRMPLVVECPLQAADVEVHDLATHP